MIVDGIPPAEFQEYYRPTEEAFHTKISYLLEPAAGRTRVVNEVEPRSRTTVAGPGAMRNAADQGQ